MILELAIDAAAVHRLTRLVTADSLTEPARSALVRSVGVSIDADELAHEAVELLRGRDPRGVPRTADLVTCRWCASVWVSFGVLAARRLFPRMWDPVARALALSSVSTLIAGLED